MGLVITEKATTKVREAIASMKFTEDQHLRVTMSPSGCGDFTYGLSFLPSKELPEGFVELEVSGLKVALDPNAAILLEETTIDFYEDENQQGFTFQNNIPKSSCGSCGCGSKKCG